MSKFYGQVFGMSRTEATRRGGSDIKVSAQSYDGSVIVKLDYNNEGKLRVRLETDKYSSSCGYTKFDGTFEEFNKVFDKKYQNYEIAKKLLDYYHIALDDEYINIIVDGATEQNYDIIDWMEFLNELEISTDIEKTLKEFDLV